MSQLKEILATEQERTSLEQCAVIHLFREGTFYRAYEWSAWLCLRYFTELKVTHRLLKGGEDIVFVGFPLTSLDRYTPQGATVLPSGEKSIEMTLPAQAFAPDTDAETLQSGFEDWKQSQPMTEASKKKVEEETGHFDVGTTRKMVCCAQFLLWLAVALEQFQCEANAAVEEASFQRLWYV